MVTEKEIIEYLENQTGIKFETFKIIVNKAGYTWLTLDLGERIDWFSPSNKVNSLLRLRFNGHGFIKRVEPNGYGKVALML